MSGEEVVYRVRALPGGRIGQFLLWMWLAGMVGMLLGLLLTFGNVVGGMAGLILPMVWLALKATKRIEFGVGPEGLRETPLDPQGKPVDGLDRRYRWEDLESWMVDADMVRGVGERRFVDLRFRDGHRMHFREPNDRPDDPGFAAFAAALESRCAEPAAPTPAAPRAPPPVPPGAAAPARRRSFYDRPIAKALTVCFLLATVGLLVLAISRPDLFNSASWFRLSVVVVPGTLYMFARTFGPRR